MNLQTPLALLTTLALTTSLGCSCCACCDQDSETPDAAADTAAVATPAALDFELPALDGSPTDLAQYHGRVVLIVNTASQCGLTPQYAQLQQLHETYADDGLAILGFPANNFGNQEPGSDEEIADFCEQNFRVGFPMFAKVSVLGDDQHPLYTYLTREDTNPGFAGDITWNFEKFLISRDGEVVARFAPRTRPDAPEVVESIQAELAKPIPGT